MAKNKASQIKPHLTGKDLLKIVLQSDIHCKKPLEEFLPEEFEGWADWLDGYACNYLGEKTRMAEAKKHLEPQKKILVKIQKEASKLRGSYAFLSSLESDIASRLEMLKNFLPHSRSGRPEEFSRNELIMGFIAFHEYVTGKIPGKRSKSFTRLVYYFFKHFGIEYRSPDEDNQVEPELIKCLGSGEDITIEDCIEKRVLYGKYTCPRCSHRNSKPLPKILKPKALTSAIETAVDTYNYKVKLHEKLLALSEDKEAMASIKAKIRTRSKDIKPI